jgi:uncharacterized protein YihD (DUF1040 family)
MRDPSRIERVLELLRDIWRNAPDLRLGQILVACAPKTPHGTDVFYVEDSMIESGMRNFAKERGIGVDEDGVTITLTKSEAIVLIHMLEPFDGVPQLTVADQAEAQALHNLCCLLEKQLIEPFRTDWDGLLADAKKELSPTD